MSHIQVVFIVARQNGIFDVHGQLFFRPYIVNDHRIEPVFHVHVPVVDGVIQRVPGELFHILEMGIPFLIEHPEILAAEILVSQSVVHQFSGFQRVRFRFGVYRSRRRVRSRFRFGFPAAAANQSGCTEQCGEQQDKDTLFHGIISFI